MQPSPSTDLTRRSVGAIVGVVGFLLSPLSWWNDMFVNVPLALAFAWMISCFYRGAFTASFVLGYWLTNVLGLVLMQHGAQAALARRLKPYGGKEIARDLVIALVYTALILTLVKLKVFAPLPAYFSPAGR